MLSMPIEIIIKTKSLGIEDVLSKLQEIKKANPHETIKVTVEIDLID